MSEIVTNTLTVSETPELKITDAAPVEAEAPAESAPAEEAPSEGQSEPKPVEAKSESDDKPKPKSRAATRLEEVLRQNSQLKRTNTRLNREIGSLRAEAPPREEDYSDPTDYAAAKVDRRIRESALERELADVNAQAQELKQTRAEVWRDRVSEARGRLPADFDQRFYSLPVTDAMAEVLTQSELGVEVGAYLAANPDEAHRISQMPVTEQAYHLGKLEGRVAPPKPKQISSAPRPVTTVAGKSHQSGKTPDQMSNDEYRKWREAQIKARGGYV